MIIWFISQNSLKPPQPESNLFTLPTSSIISNKPIPISYNENHILFHRIRNSRKYHNLL